MIFFSNFLVRGSFSSQQHPKFSQFCGTCSQIQIFCLKLCASQQHPRASLFLDLFVRASSASQRHPKTIPASQIQSKRFSKSDVTGCACHPSNLVLGMMHPSEGPFHPKWTRCLGCIIPEGIRSMLFSTFFDFSELARTILIDFGAQNGFQEGPGATCLRAFPAIGFQHDFCNSFGQKNAKPKKRKSLKIYVFPRKNKDFEGSPN